jgi:hypothetical protein
MAADSRALEAHVDRLRQLLRHAESRLEPSTAAEIGASLNALSVQAAALARAASAASASGRGPKGRPTHNSDDAASTRALRGGRQSQSHRRRGRYTVSFVMSGSGGPGGVGGGGTGGGVGSAGGVTGGTSTHPNERQYDGDDDAEQHPDEYNSDIAVAGEERGAGARGALAGGQKHYGASSSSGVRGGGGGGSAAGSGAATGPRSDDESGSGENDGAEADVDAEIGSNRAIAPGRGDGGGSHPRSFGRNSGGLLSSGSGAAFRAREEEEAEDADDDEDENDAADEDGQPEDVGDADVRGTADLRAYTGSQGGGGWATGRMGVYGGGRGLPWHFPISAGPARGHREEEEEDEEDEDAPSSGPEGDGDLEADDGDADADRDDSSRAAAAGPSVFRTTAGSSASRGGSSTVTAEGSARMNAGSLRRGHVDTGSAASADGTAGDAVAIGRLSLASQTSGSYPYAEGSRRGGGGLQGLGSGGFIPEPKGRSSAVINDVLSVNSIPRPFVGAEADGGYEYEGAYHPASAAADGGSDLSRGDDDDDGVQEEEEEDEDRRLHGHHVDIDDVDDVDEDDEDGVPVGDDDEDDEEIEINTAVEQNAEDYARDRDHGDADLRPSAAMLAASNERRRALQQGRAGGILGSSSSSAAAAASSSSSSTSQSAPYPGGSYAALYRAQQQQLGSQAAVSARFVPYSGAAGVAPPSLPASAARGRHASRAAAPAFHHRPQPPTVLAHAWRRAEREVDIWQTPSPPQQLQRGGSGGSGGSRGGVDVPHAFPPTGPVSSARERARGGVAAAQAQTQAQSQTQSLSTASVPAVPSSPPRAPAVPPSSSSSSWSPGGGRSRAGAGPAPIAALPPPVAPPASLSSSSTSNTGRALPLRKPAQSLEPDLPEMDESDESDDSSTFAHHHHQPTRLMAMRPGSAKPQRPGRTARPPLAGGARGAQAPAQSQRHALQRDAHGSSGLHSSPSGYHRAPSRGQDDEVDGCDVMGGDGTGMGAGAGSGAGTGAGAGGAGSTVSFLGHRAGSAGLIPESTASVLPAVPKSRRPVWSASSAVRRQRGALLSLGGSKGASGPDLLDVVEAADIAFGNRGRRSSDGGGAAVAL